MDKLKLDLKCKKDRNGDEYYFTTTRVPILIDLSRTVIFVYPMVEKDKEGQETYSATMVIKSHDPEKRRPGEDPDLLDTPVNTDHVKGGTNG